MKVFVYDAIAQASLELGQYPDAEAAAAKESRELGLSSIVLTPFDSGDPTLAGSERRRSEAVARQGRYAEARSIIDPFVVKARQRADADPESVSRRMELADLLITQAVAQEPDSRAGRIALLVEAHALMAGLPSEVAGTVSFRRMKDRAAAEEARLDPKR
jgi:hypothetical protein